MGEKSTFRIGDDVELWRVVGHLCVLLTFVLLLEQLLHRAEHTLHHHPKYFDMLRKVYRELMILGLLSLGFKAVKELALVKDDSENLLAFEAADVVIFLSAIALIAQAVCIFLRLRRRNKRYDGYELVSTRDLIELISHHEAVMRGKSWLQRRWPWTEPASASGPATKGSESGSFSAADYEEITRMRVLRHFFLKSQGLPELFPFAKYLRHSQDNQISHMIEIEISGWVLLMGISWALDSVTQTFHEHHDESSEGLALATMFFVFAWLVTAFHAILALYLRTQLRRVLASCGYGSERHMLKCLRMIAQSEDHQMETEVLDHALETMQHIQDEREAEQVKKDAKYNGLARHDSGLQLVILAFRWIRRSRNAEASQQPATKTRHRSQRVRTVDGENDLEASLSHSESPRQSLDRTEPLLKPPRLIFSRKLVHFLAKLLLIVNGFFFALMCQAVLYELPTIYKHSGWIAAATIPLPLFLNMFFFQPRIFRDYVLVACIFKVDVATLSEVITQFSESVELRAEFVDHLTTRMRENGQTLDDLRRHFHVSDPNGTGLVELEELRQILHHFGCQVSYFRFNDVAKLLFRLKGTYVEYAQVERLLQLAEIEDQTHEPSSRGQHYMHAVMVEEAELHRREKCSTMAGGEAWGTFVSAKGSTPVMTSTPSRDVAASSIGRSFPSAEAAIAPMVLTPVLHALSPSPQIHQQSPSDLSNRHHYYQHL